MYNILLDRLPTEYNGYLIRTSFRIGIQICLCLQDPDFTEDEKMGVAFDLLYGRGVPHDINTALDGLNWFMSCGDDSKKPTDTNEKTLFYWDFDSSRFFSSFMKTFGIDLATTDMHWFKFISMIGSLDKDCALSKAIEIRDFEAKNLNAKERAQLQKIKQNLTPETQYSTDEQKQIDKFNALFDGGDVNG